MEKIEGEERNLKSTRQNPSRFSFNFSIRRIVRYDPPRAPLEERIEWEN